MAKFGEGDPRWLVDEIGTTNPGSWHWEAKSVLNQCQSMLQSLFEEAQLAADIPEDTGSVKITKVKSVTGEAHMTTRKGGKKFAVYELVLTLEWEGKMVSDDTKVSGEVKVEELASGSDEEDYMFTVTVVGTGAVQDECKRLVTNMRGQVCEVLAKFVAKVNDI